MKQTPTRYEALRMVRAEFRSQDEMAEYFGVTQPTIWRWINQSKQIPAEYVLRAEAATGVSRHHLRPDIYPVETAQQARFLGVDRRAKRVAFERRHVSKAVSA